MAELYIRLQEGMRRGPTFVEVMLIVLVGGVLAALAAVRFDYARRAGNESAAIGALQSINAAQSAYASSCGGAGFAQSLDDLARLPVGSTQAFLNPDLASNGIVREGYVFTMQADPGATIVTPIDRICNQPKAHAMSGICAGGAGRVRGWEPLRGVQDVRDRQARGDLPARRWRADQLPRMYKGCAPAIAASIWIW